MKSVVDMVAETFEMPLLPRFSVDQIPDRDWVPPARPHLDRSED